MYEKILGKSLVAFASASGLLENISVGTGSFDDFETGTVQPENTGESASILWSSNDNGIFSYSEDAFPDSVPENQEKDNSAVVYGAIDEISLMAVDYPYDADPTRYIPLSTITDYEDIPCDVYLPGFIIYVTSGQPKVVFTNNASTFELRGNNVYKRTDSYGAYRYRVAEGTGTYIDDGALVCGKSTIIASDFNLYDESGNCYFERNISAYKPGTDTPDSGNTEIKVDLDPIITQLDTLNTSLTIVIFWLLFVWCEKKIRIAVSNITGLRERR